MKKTIAVVDDIYANRFLMEHILSDFNVRPLSNGNSLFDYLKREIPDLVILDVGLPDEDGFSIAKKMALDKRFSDIPIIFVTAHVSKKDIIEGFQSGGYDYISKPFEDQVLLDRVQAVLDKKNIERVDRTYRERK